MTGTSYFSYHNRRGCDLMHALLPRVFSIAIIMRQRAGLFDSNFSFATCVGKRWRVESFQRPKADRSKQMEKPAMLPALFVCLSPFVLLICLFLVSIQSRARWAQSAEKPRHNTAVSIDERGSMGQDPPPQACCRGPTQAGCQEWLKGPSGTSLRHLTSALQLSPALTLSRLKTHIELRQHRASGTWSITLSFYKNITNRNIIFLNQFFHYLFSWMARHVWWRVAFLTS